MHPEWRSALLGLILLPLLLAMSALLGRAVHAVIGGNDPPLAERHIP